ncbi:hypothetical protein [Bradymonas sediminis]|uniref:Uncharacterized protein n=1 Tax=Bradymonas sediminis TaxID=1548548 RepID=A0A2Z4FKI6_9DELT|nr:hypothetical protein [Bradymonas sediminis]AWV89473.1 hypothetical protein DN745_09020 [Bradymonas sediminis]TDP76801.1 hypothetical protein DFR33_102438 [Bradymonas sediminis]
MLNHQVDCGQDYSQNLESLSVTAAERRAALKTQQYIDARLSEVARQTLAALGHDTAPLSERSLRQALVYVSGKYTGGESQRFAHYCRALQLMSRQEFRAALTAFESVLVGQVEAGFEPLRQLALKLHSVCLEELEFDDQSMEQFTELLFRKFEETRANGRPDDVASQLGLGRVRAAMAF